MVSVHGFPSCCGFNIVSDLPGQSGIDKYASETARKTLNDQFNKSVSENLDRLITKGPYRNYNLFIVLNDKQEKLEFSKLLVDKYQFVKVSIEKNPNTSLLLHTYMRRSDRYRGTNEIPVLEDNNR